MRIFAILKRLLTFAIVLSSEALAFSTMFELYISSFFKFLQVKPSRHLLGFLPNTRDLSKLLLSYIAVALEGDHLVDAILRRYLLSRFWSRLTQEKFPNILDTRYHPRLVTFLQYLRSLARHPRNPMCLLHFA